MKSPERVTWDAVVAQCRNVIAASERRNPTYEGLTLAEKQERAVLWVRLDDHRETIPNAAPRVA